MGIFFAGLFVIVAAVLTGNSIQPEIGRPWLDICLAQHGAGAWLEFLLFAFGSPLGLVICATCLFVAPGLLRRYQFHSPPTGTNSMPLAVIYIAAGLLFLGGGPGAPAVRLLHHVGNPGHGVFYMGIFGCIY